MSAAASSSPQIVGRYALYAEIASGGMASVHLGRMLGPAGFSKVVAIKRLHGHLAKDPEFIAMFLDEARLAARLQHPNIVSTLDVVAVESELFLVMEYIQGESFARLMQASVAQGKPCPPRIAAAVVGGVLQGLHHAHDATSGGGDPLEIVHRDVSPQNVLVGVDGIARLLDFGIAKALGRVHQTRDGHLKGKVPYMAPETLEGRDLDRRADVYAAGVVLWEALAGRRLFEGSADPSLLARILTERVPPVSEANPSLERYDEVVARALHRDRSMRYASAHEMLLALEQCGPCATPTEVAGWVRSLASDALASRAASVSRIDQTALTVPEPAVPEPAMPSARSAERPRATIGPVTALAVSVLFLGTATLAIGLVFRGARKSDAAGAASSSEPPSSSMHAPSSAPADSEPSGAWPPASGASASDAPEPRAGGSGRRGVGRAKPACDPPYVLDSAGRRHYKMECVRRP